MWGRAMPCVWRGMASHRHLVIAVTEKTRPSREGEIGTGSYTMSSNLEAEALIPDNGILSRTQHNDDRVKVVIFGFSEGQELSAPTAPLAAALYFVRGEVRLTLGEDAHDVNAGAYIHMPPTFTHAI